MSMMDCEASSHRGGLGERTEHGGEAPGDSGDSDHPAVELGFGKFVRECNDCSKHYSKQMTLGELTSLVDPKGLETLVQDHDLRYAYLRSDEPIQGKFVAQSGDVGDLAISKIREASAVVLVDGIRRVAAMARGGGGTDVVLNVKYYEVDGVEFALLLRVVLNEARVLSPWAFFVLFRATHKTEFVKIKNNTGGRSRKQANGSPPPAKRLHDKFVENFGPTRTLDARLSLSISEIEHARRIHEWLCRGSPCLHHLVDKYLVAVDKRLTMICFHDVFVRKPEGLKMSPESPSEIGRGASSRATLDELFPALFQRPVGGGAADGGASHWNPATVTATLISGPFRRGRVFAVPCEFFGVDTYESYRKDFVKKVPERIGWLGDPRNKTVTQSVACNFLVFFVIDDGGQLAAVAAVLEKRAFFILASNKEAEDQVAQMRLPLVRDALRDGLKAWTLFADVLKWPVFTAWSCLDERDGMLETTNDPATNDAAILVFALCLALDCRMPKDLTPECLKNVRERLASPRLLDDDDDVVLGCSPSDVPAESTSSASSRDCALLYEMSMSSRGGLPHDRLQTQELVVVDAGTATTPNTQSSESTARISPGQEPSLSTMPYVEYRQHPTGVNIERAHEFLDDNPSTVRIIEGILELNRALQDRLGDHLDFTCSEEVLRKIYWRFASLADAVSLREEPNEQIFHDVPDDDDDDDDDSTRRGDRGETTNEHLASSNIHKEGPPPKKKQRALAAILLAGMGRSFGHNAKSRDEQMMTVTPSQRPRIGHSRES